MKELTQRVREDGLTMTFEHSRVTRNEIGIVDVWNVTIRGFGRALTTEYQGSVNDHKNGENPKLEEVFHCAVFDALGVDVARNARDWISEFMSADGEVSKGALGEHWKIYEKCIQLRDDLKVFLGEKKFQEYLYDTDFDV